MNDLLETWKKAATDRGYELEHDTDMEVWFAWQGDTCMGAYNLETGVATIE